MTHYFVLYFITPLYNKFIRWVNNNLSQQPKKELLLWQRRTKFKLLKFKRTMSILTSRHWLQSLPRFVISHLQGWQEVRSRRNSTKDTNMYVMYLNNLWRRLKSKEGRETWQVSHSSHDNVSRLLYLGRWRSGGLDTRFILITLTRQEVLMEPRYNEQIKKEDFDWDFGLFIAFAIIVMVGLAVLYVWHNRSWMGRYGLWHIGTNEIR